MLGAFFNGVLLFGLGISVCLQSIERFVSLQGPFGFREAIGPQSNASEQTEVEKPKLVFIMGAIGFGLNIISILFLHSNNIASVSAMLDSIF